MKCAIFLIEEFLFQDSCLWWKWNDRISLRAVSFITHFFFCFLNKHQKTRTIEYKKKNQDQPYGLWSKHRSRCIFRLLNFVRFQMKMKSYQQDSSTWNISEEKKREKNSLQYWFEYLNLEWLEYWFQPLTAQGKRMKSAKMCHASSRDPRGNRSRINSDLIIWSNESLSLYLSRCKVLATSSSLIIANINVNHSTI